MVKSDTSVRVKPDRERSLAQGGSVRIGELSRRSGASVRSLRHYEQQGLLSATRTSGNYRDYPDTSLDTVHVIRTLLQAGLTTATIGRLLPCIELIGGQATPCSDLLTELHHERQHLDQQRQALTRSTGILDTVIAAAR